MSIKQELEWFQTSEKQYPDKPGKSCYEHVDCIVMSIHHGQRFLSWNCEELVWDDIDRDDFDCQPAEVVAWAEIPDPPVFGGA